MTVVLCFSQCTASTHESLYCYKYFNLFELIGIEKIQTIEYPCVFEERLKNNTLSIKLMWNEDIFYTVLFKQNEEGEVYSEEQKYEGGTNLIFREYLINNKLHQHCWNKETREYLSYKVIDSTGWTEYNFYDGLSFIENNKILKEEQFSKYISNFNILHVILEKDVVKIKTDYYLKQDFEETIIDSTIECYNLNEFDYTYYLYFGHLMNRM